MNAERRAIRVTSAVSDIPFQFMPEDGSAPENPAPGSYAYIPIVAGGTAFIYNLMIDGQRATSLRLSGENVVKIFTGLITNWNDPALQSDNPGITLPSRQIVPVVRSDSAGSTAQFTTWMISQHLALWNDYCQRSGRAPACGSTSFYPTTNTDSSDPAVYLTQQVDGVYADTDPRNYQLSSYSYLIVPTQVGGRFTPDRGQTLGVFAYYALCQAQQQSAALGYSPMPVNLVQAGFDQIRKIPGAVVQDIDITTCNNPTFSPIGTDLLAANAPQPLSCDRQGPTQCPDSAAPPPDVPEAEISVLLSLSAAVTGAAAMWFLGRRRWSATRIQEVRQ